VYICGRNFQGQLGLGDPAAFPKNERNHPFQAKFLPIESLRGKRVAQIACGGEHSVALTEDGEVYTFGAGNKGQLGHGLAANEHFPRLLEELHRTGRDVHQVACGNNCTLILAGVYNPHSLVQICLDTIRSNASLMADLHEAPDLPSGLLHQLTGEVSSDGDDSQRESDTF